MDRQTTPGLAGTVLDGRYRVGGLVARGGMSTVYRGVDLRLDRPVAIKVMKPEFAADSTFLTRFEREARSAAGLGHPGVVSVYDHGRDGEHVFLVMELVDGGTLRDLLKQQGSLSVPVALSILEPVLSALGAAHDAGLVHRDVKPENVLISSKGEVKVADFGLVRAISSNTMMTGNVILGTVAYLSPEQVSTGFADARSDVYSAGVLAFEMLTGAPPYGGENAISVAYQHVHSDVPPVSKQAPGVPAAIDELLLDATSRDSSLRPRDAGTFLSDLVRIRARLNIRRVPVPVPARRKPARPAEQSSAPPHPSGPTRPVRPSGATARQPAPHGPTGTRMVPAERAAESLEPNEQMVAVPYPRRRRRRLIIAIIIVLLLGLAAAAGGWWLGSGRWTAVPAVVGVSQSTAEQNLREADLVFTVTQAYDNTVEAGRVVSVVPGPGERQLRGTEVTVTVSDGKPKVPQIEVGSDPAAAAQIIEAATLRARVNTAGPVFDDSVASGKVVEIQPKPGSAVDIGSTVVVIVSKGPAPASIPPVADKTVDDAENALVASGFTVGTQINQFDPEQPAGVVLSSRPAAGNSIPKGTAVQLVVSNSLTVPELAGSSQAKATADLSGAGLQATVGEPEFSADIDGGSVIRSSPPAGSLVDPASALVTIVVSNAITMPDVLDQDLDGSAAQLDKLGFYVQVSSFWGFGDNVRTQIPEPGTRVAPGSTVQISSLP